MTTISNGNWTNYVQNFVKNKEVANYIVGGNGEPDPAYGCLKDFTATYQCGNLQNIKTINIPGEAGGKTAVFDCTDENNVCSGFRLTLGDDGNLILTDGSNSKIWTSNTNKTGLSLDEFKASRGKYGRNYLLAGETLGLGEFIGSPSGNCYLIMTNGTNGNGLQLNYSVMNCNEQNFGNDEDTNGLFSLAKTAYNELIESQNKIKPKMKTLDKTLSMENKLFINKRKGFTNDIKNDIELKGVKPLLQKNIKQFEAMEEDTSLYLTRYSYRRIVWLMVAILVLYTGIKLTRNNNTV